MLVNIKQKFNLWLHLIKSKFDLYAVPPSRFIILARCGQIMQKNALPTSYMLNDGITCDILFQYLAARIRRPFRLHCLMFFMFCCDFVAPAPVNCCLGRRLDCLWRQKEFFIVCANCALPAPAAIRVAEPGNARYGVLTFFHTDTVFYAQLYFWLSLSKIEHVTLHMAVRNRNYHTATGNYFCTIFSPSEYRLPVWTDNGKMHSEFDYKIFAYLDLPI